MLRGQGQLCLQTPGRKVTVGGLFATAFGGRGSLQIPEAVLRDRDRQSTADPDPRVERELWAATVPTGAPVNWL